MVQASHHFVFVRFWNGRDHSYRYSYGPDHSNTEPFENRLSKRLVFEWRSVWGVRYSSPPTVLKYLVATPF